MANKILLFLLLALLCVHFIECKGRVLRISTGGRRSGSGGSRGGSRSGSRSSGSSSSHSGSRHTYPSSSGMSGSGYSHPSAGSGSGKNLYPSSVTGLSGTGSHNSYSPSSGYGYNYHSSSSSGSGNQRQTYPSSGGLSGNGGNKNPSSNVYSSSNSYGKSNQHHYGYGSGYAPHTAPQYVYVTEYRNSDSRYSDLLTGLTLYNLGRSHSHHHDHYYHDDYYNVRYGGSRPSSYGGSSSSYPAPKDSAVCKLKIKDDNSVETVKIPCEIVSTFTGDSEKVPAKNIVNNTVCVTETTVVNNVSSKSEAQLNNTALNMMDIPAKMNITEGQKNASTTDKPAFDTSSINALLVQPITTNAPQTAKPETIPKLGSNNSKMTVMNVTKCTTTVNTTDPLKVTGPAINPSGKECIVEIQTQSSLLQNKINCTTLIKYAKMPEPKKSESSVMPSRSTLKTWMKSPPWWMSMFIAV